MPFDTNTKDLTNVGYANELLSTSINGIGNCDPTAIFYTAMWVGRLDLSKEDVGLLTKISADQWKELTVNLHDEEAVKIATDNQSLGNNHMDGITEPAYEAFENKTKKILAGFQFTVEKIEVLVGLIFQVLAIICAIAALLTASTEIGPLIFGALAIICQSLVIVLGFYFVVGKTVLDVVIKLLPDEFKRPLVDSIPRAFDLTGTWVTSWLGGPESGDGGIDFDREYHVLIAENEQVVGLSVIAQDGYGITNLQVRVSESGKSPKVAKSLSHKGEPNHTWVTKELNGKLISFDAPGGQVIQGFQSINMNRYGLVNIRPVTCPDKKVGKWLTDFETDKSEGAKRYNYTPDCPSERLGKLRIISVREQDGYGIVDIRYIYKMKEPRKPKEIPTGYVKIRPGKGGDACIEVEDGSDNPGKRIQLYNSDGKRTLWRIEHFRDDVYRIRNAMSDKILTVEGLQQGSKAKLSDGDSYDEFKVREHPYYPERWIFEPKDNPLARVECEKGNLGNGTAIQLWPTSQERTHWKLVQS